MFWAQDSHVIDSLKLSLKNAKHDTLRCNILSVLIESENNDAIWSKYNEQLRTIAEENISKLPRDHQEYKFYKKHLGGAFNNMGFLYRNQGNIQKALEYYGRSLKVQEEIGDKSGMASSLNNHGDIYRSQGDVEKALEYFNKSLKIKLEIGDPEAIATSLVNIGAIHGSLGDLKKALEFFHRSLEIREKAGDKEGIATSLINIGGVYSSYGDIDKALDYFIRSLKLREEIGDKEGQAASLNNIGGIYLTKRNYSKALEYSKRSMTLSKELGYPRNIRNSAKILSQVYKAAGNYKLALENFEIFIQMRDSISNEATRKASVKQQLKHEYETRAAADSVAHAMESEIKNAELKKQEAEIKAKKNQQLALFGGLFLVVMFAGFMFNRWKVTQKQKVVIELQKTEVEEQKKLVEEKQKEILDSIHYAKRIQIAQIPSEKWVISALNRLRK